MSAAAQIERNPGRAGRAVVIRGQAFASLAAAARHFDLCEATVRNAYARGPEALQKVGLRQAFVPVTIDGITYPSRAEAARKTGVPYATLRGL